MARLMYLPCILTTVELRLNVSFLNLKQENTMEEALNCGDVGMNNDKSD